MIRLVGRELGEGGGGKKILQRVQVFAEVSTDGRQLTGSERFSIPA